MNNENKEEEVVVAPEAPVETPVDAAVEEAGSLVEPLEVEVAEEVNAEEKGIA